MNAEFAASIVADLLPIAESLFSLVDKIRTQAPDVWASVSADYDKAVNDWLSAKSAVAESVSSHDVAGATLIAKMDAANVITESPSAPATPAVGTSSAEQAAAGIPLAHYTG